MIIVPKDTFLDKVLGRRKFPLILQLNAPLSREECTAQWQKPLDKALWDGHIGIATDSGVAMTASGAIEHCFVELELDEKSDEHFDKLLELLKTFDVPKGSLLISGSQRQEL